MRPLGSLLDHLESHVEASGSVLGGLWATFRASWELVGASSERLGSLLGRLGSVLGAFRKHTEAFWEVF